MEDIHSAKQDFLTNCYTRESINPYLVKLMAEHKAYNKEFSIILLDIDHFKPFNDKYGHLDGDELLKYFASSLRLGLARVDSTIYRFGGDEFIIVLPEKSGSDAHKIAAGLQDTLRSRPFLLAGKLLKMSFSGGVAACATDGDTPEKLIASADKAMYISKKRGRARTTLYNRIWLDRIEMAGLVAIVLLAIAAAASFSHLSSKGYISRPIFSMKLTKPSSRTIAPAVPASRAVKLRLKTGSVIKGQIIKENEREIELLLSLDKGEGSVTVKKALIRSIER